MATEKGSERVTGENQQDVLTGQVPVDPREDDEGERPERSGPIKRKAGGWGTPGGKRW